jgi:hypothetical protein
VRQFPLEREQGYGEAWWETETLENIRDRYARRREWEA